MIILKISVVQAARHESRFADLRFIKSQTGASSSRPHQEALARRLEYSLGYIARLELGQHDPPISTLARLAKALRATLAELVG
ncbi:MAG TPA: helix-turn-helix transcriptional regulator [Nitrospira sp.]|nr:helix-turn-helix transcriptional regulator [Nitrospira sp.]